MAIHVGICTISFSTLPVDEALALCAAADARGVELWGRGHLTDDAPSAEVTRVRRLAEGHGLRIASYGSYMRAGLPNWTPHEVDGLFERVVDLGAPVVRVWAGEKGSASASPQDWREVRDALRAWGDLAADHDLRIVVERHCNTLTDFGETAYRLIEDVGHAAVLLNYQVPYPTPLAFYRTGLTEDLRQHLPVSAHIHVQNYREENGGVRRVSVVDGAIDYAAWLPLLREARFNGWAMLEFLPEGEDLPPADLAAREVSALRAMWSGQATAARER